MNKVITTAVDYCAMFHLLGSLGYFPIGTSSRSIDKQVEWAYRAYEDGVITKDEVVGLADWIRKN